MTVYLINHPLLGDNTAVLYSIGWLEQNDVTQSAQSSPLKHAIALREWSTIEPQRRGHVLYNPVNRHKKVCFKKCISPAAFNRSLSEDFSHS